MPNNRFGKLIITELNAPAQVMAALPEYSRFGKRILWIDNRVVEGSFQMNCSWYLRPKESSPAPHAHDVDEIIGFFGNDPDNPYDPGAEIEFWIENEQFIINRSVLIFIPAGVKHCPLILRRVDRPIIHFSVVAGDEYTMRDTGWKAPPATGYCNHIVTDLKIPLDKQSIAEKYNKYARRILWMDERVVPGAFQMNTDWFLKAGQTLENGPHVHQDDEIIGFLGSNPDSPGDLGGEVKIWLGGEQHILNRSSMLFVPAGLYHYPLILRHVYQPIFHFSVTFGKRHLRSDLK